MSSSPIVPLGRFEQSEGWGTLVILRDFNCVLMGEEQNSGRGVVTSYANLVMERGLIDLRFIGPKFTWNHGVSVETR